MLGTLLPYLLLLVALLLLLYLFLYFRSLYLAGRFFRLYASTDSIARELPQNLRTPGPLSFLRPSFPLALSSRILELELLFDFVEEVGSVDLRSIRRDYFDALRTGVRGTVVEPLGYHSKAEGE